MNGRRLISWVVAFACALAASGAQSGQPSEQGRDARVVRVWVRTGPQPLVGVLVSESEEQIVLDIEGVRQTIPRRDIVTIAEEVSVEEKYRAMRRNVSDEDADLRRQIARWLMREHRYDLAVEELEGILKVDPYSQETADLLRIASAQLALQQRAHQGKRSDANEPPPDRGPPVPLLTPEEINLLRVYEVNLASPPRMTVAPEAVLRFLDAYGSDPLLPQTEAGRQAFLKEGASVVLREMFRLRAREFYGEIKVHDDPRPFALFRDHVNRTWLVNYCASNECHGGNEAGRLRLVSRQSRTDAGVYTNFLILDRFRLEDGSPLIDYSTPSRSPLLQMGLPREEAATPHPEVPVGPSGRDVWRPIFRSVEDRRYRQALDWIMSHYQPRPEYPVEYPRPTAENPNNHQPR